VFFAACGLAKKVERGVPTRSTPILFQQLKRVDPVVLQEAGDAPEHAERFDRARGPGRAHVRRFPAELIQNHRHGFFRRVIVAANKHRGFPARKLRVHHAGTANGIERLHKPDSDKLALQLLHRRLVEVREKLQHAVDRRGVSNGIGRVDHGFPSEIRHAGRAHRLRGHRALDREHGQLSKFRGVGKAADPGLGISRAPVRQFGRIARAHRHVMAMLQKSNAQRLRHIAGPDDADLHGLIVSIKSQNANGMQRIYTPNNGEWGFAGPSRNPQRPCKFFLPRIALVGADRHLRIRVHPPAVRSSSHEAKEGAICGENLASIGMN
jgi:hypothetical protein